MKHNFYPFSHYNDGNYTTIRSPVVNDTNLSIQDHPIQGKLVAVKKYISEYEMLKIESEDDLKKNIKHDIAHQLALEMIDKQLIEINKRIDPSTNTTEIIARAYLVPNEQIKILRTIKK